MKILVLSINSAEFESRKKTISEKLNGYDWCFIDAFDARKLATIELSRLFDKGAFYNKYHRYPSSGEIGCTLSHISIYQYIVDYDLPYALILEDDAIIDSDFESFFSDCNIGGLMVNEPSIYVLGHSKVSKKNGFFYNFVYPIAIKKKINGYSFGVSRYLNLCGTVAYMITNQAAKMILSRVFDKPYHLADDWKYLYDTGVSIYHSRPLLILENFWGFDSSIESERKLLQKVDGHKVVCRDNFFYSKKSIFDKCLFMFILVFKSIIKWVFLRFQ